MSLPACTDLNNAELRATLQSLLDNKTKPLGSLGRIEQLALQLGLILQTTRPVLQAPQVLVCAGDHGLARRGVSAYPQDVTWQMVENFLAGGAAISVLAKQHGMGLTVADCGVAHDFAPRPLLRNCKIAPDTADCTQGPAMTAQQCAQAIANGQALVQSLPGNVLLLGEMGIGNTSAASLIAARLLNLDIAQCTGAGTGLDADGVQRKTVVLQQALAANPQATDPLAVLAAFGGFEIAAMTGAYIAAAQAGLPVIVDGLICTVSALAARLLNPRVEDWFLYGHQSAEPAHARVLEALQAKPLLKLGMRLGEGSGAATAFPLLQLACALHGQMATFAEAGVTSSDV